MSNYSGEIRQDKLITLTNQQALVKDRMRTDSSMFRSTEIRNEKYNNICRSAGYLHYAKSINKDNELASNQNNSLFEMGKEQQYFKLQKILGFVKNKKEIGKFKSGANKVGSFKNNSISNCYLSEDRTEVDNYDERKSDVARNQSMCMQPSDYIITRKYKALPKISSAILNKKSNMMKDSVFQPLASTQLEVNSQHFLPYKLISEFESPQNFGRRPILASGNDYSVRRSHKMLRGIETEHHASSPIKIKRIDIRGSSNHNTKTMTSEKILEEKDNFLKNCNMDIVLEDTRRQEETL